MSEEVQAPDVTTAFAVVMTLDGQVHVLADLPLTMVRTPSRTDIHMMSSFVRDTLMKQSTEPKPVDPAAAIQARLVERMSE